MTCVLDTEVALKGGAGQPAVVLPWGGHKYRNGAYVTDPDVPAYIAPCIPIAGVVDMVDVRGESSHCHTMAPVVAFKAHMPPSASSGMQNKLSRCKNKPTTTGPTSLSLSLFLSLSFSLSSRPQRQGTKTTYNTTAFQNTRHPVRPARRVWQYPASTRRRCCLHTRPIATCGRRCG